MSDRTGVAVTAPGDELAARRARRAPRWLQVAAVVAGVAVIGGGSYAYGLNSAPETITAAPAITLDDGAARDAAAPEVASMAGSGAGLAADAKLMYPWWGGRTVFTASGLSTEGGSGDAWGFDAAGTCSEATVGRGGCGARGVRAAAARVRHVDRRPERRLGCVACRCRRTVSRACPTTTRRGTRGTACGPRRTSIVEPRRCGGHGRGQRRVPEPAIVDPPADCTTSEPGPDG